VARRFVRPHLTAAAGLWLAWLCVSTVPAHAQRLDRSPAERARDAAEVVVGRVQSVTPVWRTNDFGDRLIVSVVHVAVDETLKGTAGPSVDVEVEGGTIGNLTLRVSDLDTFKTGDRAVFYLRRNRRGAFVPHLRNLGLQRLDPAGRARDDGVTLEEIRRGVREHAGRER
jgi:hypothetical protein